MKKRILSILLALFVMVAALPMAFGTVSAAWDITLSETNFPTHVEYKTANNFPTEANTFQSLTGEPEGWDNGVENAPEDYARFSGETAATLEVAEGKATVIAPATEESQDNKDIHTMILFKSLTEEDTNYIAIHIDASGLNNDEYCQLSVSNREQTLYALTATEYYFLPDATEENPNPTVETRKTNGTYGVWHNTPFYINKGDKGTLYLPETLFGIVEGFNNYVDPETKSGAWNGDFSKLVPASWYVSQSNRGLVSIRFNFKGGMAVGDSITFSNMQWVSASSYSDTYKYQYITEDFSDVDSVTASAWGDYGASNDMFSVADGVWKHTLSTDTWTDETTTLKYGYTLTLDYPVTENFKAIRYDVDLSSLDTAPSIQITYNVKNTNVDRNAYVRRYIVSGGPVYLVGADGSVDTITVGNSNWPWFALPQGFKGTVVIPFESLKNLTAGDYTYDGTQVDLYKTDDVNNYGITVDMKGIDYADKGEVITYDSFGYLTDSKLPVPVADYTYSKYHIYENIRTFEDFEISSSVLGTWADGNTSNVSLDNFSLENGLLKFTAPDEFNIETEATEETEATYYTKSSIGITNANLPNVTSEDQKAVSFYIDRSASAKQTYLRVNYFADNDNAYQPGIGGVVYLIDTDGKITSHIIEDPWSSVCLPAGFEGTVVIPFSSYKTEWGWGEFISTSTVLKETQENSAKLVIYLLEATPSEVYYFSNIDYLEEYENADLVTLRKGLMNAVDGEDIDVNGDTFVDVRDIVRLKKVLADAFIN